MDLHPRLIELVRASAFRRPGGSGGNQADGANDLEDYIGNFASLKKHMVDFESKCWLVFDCINLGYSQNVDPGQDQGRAILILRGHYLDGAQLGSSQIYSDGQALCIRFKMAGLHLVRDFVHIGFEAEASCHLCYSFRVPPAPRTHYRSQPVFQVQVQRCHGLPTGASLADAAG